LLNHRGVDHVSDEGSKPLRSNRAVENAAITFVLAYERLTDGKPQTRVEGMHHLTSRATPG
jgi:hypothetical protein